MKAVILAGGKGTRLGNLTREIPKPMLSLLGKPLLEYQVELLREYGITEIWILVNYLKDAIIQYFGNGAAWNVSIQYYEETEPLGTTGGIKAIESQLTDDFLVLYGDVMVNMNLNRLIHFHQTQKADATLVLHPNDHPFDSDLVELNQQKRITAFHPKPHPEDEYFRNLVNAGLYVLSPKILNALPQGIARDFGRDIFPSIVSTYYLAGYNTTEYLKDMGTPDRLKKVEADLFSGRVERKSYKYWQKAIFLDRDGVLNDDTEFIHRAEDLVLYADVPEAIRKINQSDYASIVVTNQSVVARNLCSEEYLRVIHNKMETDLGKFGAWLDDIYYCPHHPDKGYPDENPNYKIDCNCRKPKPGMLFQAAADYHIDLQKSWMIGDNERDIEAGHAANCKIIGLATGKGLKATTLVPDYFFFTLKEAVDFIIDEPYLPLADEIKEQLLASSNHPFIIAIGGNSQSGKTTLANFLKDYFIENNISVLKITLDDWILPLEKRSPSHDVYQNFQTEKIQADLKRLLQGEEVQVSGYARHSLRKPVPVTYRFTGEQIIIIEGVVALAIPILKEQAHLRLFKSITKFELEKRIRRLYAWKGYNEQKIQELWEERSQSEYPIIEQTSGAAHRII
ncbi:MAG: HAD-IIIA family hydrolase [Flavobacteriales bacterium]|nr:HAD-IIIA family hydrolase [Flavobacteriales bacterium]